MAAGETQAYNKAVSRNGYVCGGITANQALCCAAGGENNDESDEEAKKGPAPLQNVKIAPFDQNNWYRQYMTSESQSSSNRSTTRNNGYRKLIVFSQHSSKKLKYRNTEVQEPQIMNRTNENRSFIGQSYEKRVR